MPAPTETSLPSDLLTLESRDGARIRVSLYGGHLCSWCGIDGTERLFVSRRTRWDRSSALRGGVPIIFPQFADFGTLPKHGFARIANWTLDHSECAADGAGVLRLTLRDGAASRAFAGNFLLALTLKFSDRRLEMALSVTNTGQRAFEFCAALHTYLRAEIARSSVGGFNGQTYRDSANQGRTVVAQVDAATAGTLPIDREIDRIYQGLRKRVTLHTPEHMIDITQSGFDDVVLWNPWREKAAAIADLDKDDYLRFVCIEAALVNHPATLQAGESWLGTQMLEVRACGSIAATD